MRAKSSKQRCPALCILDLSYNVKYHWSCRVGGCYGHLTANGSWHGFPGVDHEGRQDIAAIHGIIDFNTTFHHSFFAKWNLLQNNQLRHFRYALYDSQRSLPAFTVISLQSPWVRSAVSFQSPSILCRSTTSWRLRCELKIFWTGLKNFCSLATPLRMRWDWKMFNLQGSCSQSRQSLRAA